MVVYIATNKINGKIYVGATTLTLKQRVATHKKDSYRTDRKRTLFNKAIVEFGIDNFEFKEICFCDNKQELYELEKYYIKYYDSNNLDIGYNLDSGGGFGYTKHEITKRKIGDTTIEKLKNPEIAKKMKAGLLKGSETMKEKGRNNFVDFICPVCGTIVKIKPCNVKKRKTCGLSCNGKTIGAIEGAKRGSLVIHNKNIAAKNIIKQDIVEWAINNPEIIINCPANRISTTLKPLFDMLFNKYNIMDFRSYFICFNVKNRKEFLIELQKLVQ